MKGASQLQSVESICNTSIWDTSQIDVSHIDATYKYA